MSRDSGEFTSQESDQAALNVLKRWFFGKGGVDMSDVGSKAPKYPRGVLTLPAKHIKSADRKNLTVTVEFVTKFNNVTRKKTYKNLPLKTHGSLYKGNLKVNKNLPVDVTLSNGQKSKGHLCTLDTGTKENKENKENSIFLNAVSLPVGRFGQRRDYLLPEEYWIEVS